MIVWANRKRPLTVQGNAESTPLKRSLGIGDYYVEGLATPWRDGAVDVAIVARITCILGYYDALGVARVG